jgi:hypothetical protein
MSEEKGISKQDLKDILAAVAVQNSEMLKDVISELKKPNVVEQKELDRLAQELADRNQERKDNSAGIIQLTEQKRAIQSICSHKHKDGNSHCVQISERQGPGYILCQKNQCKIRPGIAPDGYNGTDIYDNRLYNQLFQELPTNELFS